MNPARDNLRFYLIGNFNRLENWRWILILLVGLGLFTAEVYEFIELSALNQPFHFGEVVLYAVLLVGVGLFVELFVRLNRIHKKMASILDFKHKLSLELSLVNDWDALTARLAELPGKIAPVEEVYLISTNPFGGGLETLGHWRDPALKTDAWDPGKMCRSCSFLLTTKGSAIHRCERLEDMPRSQVYAVRIVDGSSPLTLLRFRLKPGISLSEEEEKSFIRIADEVGVALHVGRDHLRISELQSAQVAMAERRLVSAYVHDRVGQNLGYLHLKLDQLAENAQAIPPDEAEAELKQLREVANDSYEIVRDILKNLQMETIPNLTNLLKEHARRIGRSNNIEMDFHSVGEPIMLSPEVQHAVFFAFREVLSNVEKHSRASKVQVLVTWQGGLLDISIKDNGKGFDPGAVRKDEHFGLEILQERIQALKGKLMIYSSADAGTVVSISVPV